MFKKKIFVVILLTFFVSFSNISAQNLSYFEKASLGVYCFFSDCQTEKVTTVQKIEKVKEKEIHKVEKTKKEEKIIQPIVHQTEKIIYKTIKSTPIVVKQYPKKIIEKTVKETIIEEYNDNSLTKKIRNNRKLISQITQLIGNINSDDDDLSDNSINDLSDVNTVIAPLTNGQVLTWNNITSQWEAGSASAGNTDNQQLSLNNITNIATLSNGTGADSSIDLTQYLDNTDNQNLTSATLNNATHVLTIAIEDGSSVNVDLTNLINDADFDVTNEIQDLHLAGNNLTITNNVGATTIDLSPYLDNTDDQQIDTFSLVANVLTLEMENDGQPAQTVNLSAYLDNTDNQQISRTGDTITLANGTGANTTVDLSPYITNTESIDELADVDTTTNIPTNNQVLSWDGANWVPANNNEHTGTEGSIFFANNTNGEPTEDNTNLFWRNGNNRLGIRTNTPTQALDVNGSIVLSGDDRNIYSGNRLNIAGDSGIDFIVDNNDNSTNLSHFRFKRDGDGSEVLMIIRENGNVGIGDTTPDALLDVAGSFRLDGTFADASGDVGTAGQILSSTAVGTDWIDASGLALGSIDNHSDVDTTTTAPTNNQVLSWNGANWVPANATVNTDNQQIALNGVTNILTLSNGTGADTTADFSAYLDNTDNQDLTLVGNTLAISNDPNTDVDLAPYLDNTDNQQIDTFNIAANTLHLSLEDDGVADYTVDLSPYLDNTDSQTLSFNGGTNVLSLTNGGTVDLTSLNDEYTVGTGLNLTGNTFNLADTAVTTGSYGNATQTATFTVDQQGRLTAAGNTTITPAWTSITGRPAGLDDGDDDTTYTAGGTLLNLTGTTFSVNEGALTNNRICTYVAGTGLVCNTDPNTLALGSIDNHSDVDTTTTAPTNNQVLSWNGANWVPANATVNTDNQQIALNGATNTLTLSNGTGANTTADFSAYLDNTDNQDLTLTGNTLAISNDPNTDVDLAPYLDNTDNQQIDTFSIAANTLTLEIEDDGQPAQTVDLAPYLDNTDDQNISGSGLAGDTLTIGIENGTNETVSLAQYALDTDLHNALTLAAGRDYLTLGAGQVLTLNVVDISDDTNLTAGTGLSLTGDTVSLNSGIDNLTDVDTTTTAPNNGDLLTWDGANWVTTSPTNYTDNIYTADGTLTGNRTVTGNSNTLTFTDTQVGINRVATNHALEVYGDDYDNMLGLYTLPGDGAAGMQFFPEGSLGMSILSTGDGNDARMIVVGDQDFAIDSNGVNNRFFIQGSDGNVGINTSSPSETLDVNGDTRLRGALYDFNNQPGTAGQILSSTVAGTDWIDASGLALGSIDNHSDVDTTTTAPNNEDLLTWDGANWVTTSATSYTNNIYTADGTLTGDRTVALNGNDLYFTGSGNVGIGTTSPVNKLQVNGNVRATRFVSSNGTAGSPAFRFDSDSNTGMFRAGADRLAFTTGGSERMRIDNNGRVGIGTPSPDSQLQVNGNAHINRNLRVDDSEIIYTDHSYRDATLGYDLNWNLLQTEKTDDPNDRDFATITSGTGWKQGFPITRWKVGAEGDNGQHYGYVGYFPGDNWHPLFRVNTGGGDKTDLALGVMTKDVINITASDFYVGIGTDSPTQLLDVAGTMRLRNAFYDRNNQPGTAGQILSSTVNGTDWIDTSSLALGSIDTHSDVDTTTTAPTNNQVLSWNGANWVPTDNNEHTGITGSIFFAGVGGEPTENNNNLFWDNINDKLGLGTITPDEQLHVAQNMRLDHSFEDKDGDAGTMGQVLTSTVTGTDWVDNTAQPIPFISSISDMPVQPNSVGTYTIAGYNFTPTSAVAITGANTINSVNVLSPTEIEINVTASNVLGSYDVVISNSGILNTQWTNNGNGMFRVEQADGTSQARAGESCKAILDDGFSTGDGQYWINPDSGSTSNAFQVYCDMTTSGGGWTRIEYAADFPHQAHFSNGDTSRWLDPADEFTLTLTDTQINDIRAVSTEGKQSYVGTCDGVIHYNYNSGNYAYAFGFRFHNGDETAYEQQTYPSTNITVSADGCSSNNNSSTDTIFEISDVRVPVISVHSRDNSSTEQFGSPLTSNPAWLR